MPLVIFAVISVCANMAVFALAVAGYRNGYIVLGSNQVEVATLALTSAALVLAAVGALVALITFVGYGEIKKASITAATKVARTTSVRIASTIAADVARSAATRVARETEPTETTEEEAAEIVKAVVAENNG